jgi:hypothetical protein
MWCMRRVRQLIFATALPAKKGPGRRGEVSAGAQRLRWNFSVSVPSWRQTNAVGRVRSFLCFDHLADANNISRPR